MKIFLKIFDGIESVMVGIAQVAIFVLMILTSMDATLRYIFNSPITGATFFSERYVLVLIVFFGLSHVMKTGGHIHIEIFLKYLPRKLLKVLDVIYPLLMAAFMFAVTYESMDVTVDYFIKKSFTAGIIHWPLWLSWVWVPIGSFMFTIRLIIKAVQNLSGSGPDTGENNSVNSMLDNSLS